MELSFHLSEIHWLPVLVMTIFSFLLGSVWHMKFLFGKTWTSENYGEESPGKGNIPLMFGGTALAHLLLIATLGALVADKGAMKGMLTAFLISLFWVLPVMAGTYLFAGRSVKLLAIDAGMYMLLFTLSGLVLGIW